MTGRTIETVELLSTTCDDDVRTMAVAFSIGFPKLVAMAEIGPVGMARLVTLLGRTLAGTGMLLGTTPTEL